jgi:hypothetical protein
VESVKSAAQIAIFCFASLTVLFSQETRNSLTGHYEGTATTRRNEVFRVALAVNGSVSVLTGRIATPQAIYPLLSGAQDGDRTTITFDADRETGTVSGTLSGGKLTGTFKLGDESGSLDLTRKSETPVLSGKSPFATPIMFLGVYHMDNPGLDEVNLQADDVRSPKRQQELDDLVQKLAQFKPTVIAIEAPYGDHTWPDRYQKYLAGQYTLGRNEIEQIGVRGAKYTWIYKTTLRDEDKIRAVVQEHGLEVK